jgi:hypothetical protein
MLRLGKNECRLDCWVGMPAELEGQIFSGRISAENRRYKQMA